ncbi:MAG: uridine kinase [Candidatus Limiplasma sp.]|nr:uridine kinase [Candidatus Limiplasma sp.]MEA5145858.1 uridine kinase [Candidatus Limiplasma sp.]
MLVIGICGASGSGKSTLASELCKAIGDGCIIINHDSYYRDHSHLPFQDRALLNYDEPGIFDHDLFLQDIKTLMAGKPITRKAYDYNEHRRADREDEFIYPAQVLLIEGIHVFFDEQLCELMFLKLYMSVEPDICLLRRISRDINERGRAIDNISLQYLTTVKPMYDKYIRNYINLADVIVAHGGRNARIVDILAGYVRDELGGQA